MKNLNPRFLYLLPLLLTVALIVFGEALGDLWKEDVKAVFLQNKWLLLAFVLLLALVGFLWERQQRSEKTVAEEVDKDQYDDAFGKFKELLKEQYQIRLNSKTGRRLPVNLTAKSTHFGTAPERVEAYFKDKALTIESENIASEIDKILKANDRLLLIGDPGAGKTTILLYAAINILNTSYSSDDSKSSDELQKLPLILNLATWSEGRDFAEWYAQNIAHTYSLNPVFVQELLRRNAVVPFFDGFDEVAEDYRNDCFQKMAAYFGDEKRKQLIVSSRKKEYAAALADAPVYAEIEVQPLSLAQIKKALSENAQSQAADRALLHALEHDKWLAEAVETPFYLNTASFLFGKGQRTLADFPFEANSTEGRQTELVEIFVAEQVPEERDRKYLHFLAGKMEEDRFLVFELVSMQPKWCEHLWRYKFALSLVIWFTVGLIIILYITIFLGWIWVTDPKQSNSLSEQLGFILFLSLVTSLPIGLVAGSVTGVASSEISTADVQTWHWISFIKNWKQPLLWGFIGGAFGAWALGLLLASIVGFVHVFVGDDTTFRFFDYFFKDWDLFFTIGSNVGLGIGLIGGLILGIRAAGISTKLLLQIPFPYQRFLSTFKSMIWEMQITLLAILTGFITLEKKVEGFLDTITGSFFLLLLISLIILHPIIKSQIPQHFTLRLVLYLEGKMPLRVVAFMDRMTDQLIFEDNRRTDKKGKKMRGATWRFRHKILQDYFAGHSA